MMLDEIVRRQRDKIALRDKVKRATEEAQRQQLGGRGATAGKTIGIRIPDDLRARLEAQQRSHGLRTYTTTVALCVSLGVQALEMAGGEW